MAKMISCPKCDTVTKMAGFPVWTILASIFLFPFGLVALLVGRNPTKCQSCNFIFKP